MKMMISLGLCLLALTAGGCHKKPTPPPDDKPPFTYDDHIGPSWHPSDTMIVYYKTYSIEDSVDQIGLWAIKPSGENNRPYLVQGQNQLFGYIWSPEWSPDGNWLVFCTSWENNIYKIKWNGDSLTKLTFDGSNIHPKWSPDGGMISYIDNSDIDNRGLYVMAKDGSNNKCVYNNMVQAQDWLNDVDVAMITLVSGGSRIYRTNTNSTDTSFLFLLSNWYAVGSMNLSNDKSKIVLSVNTMSSALPQIGVVNIDGSNFQVLTSFSSGECGGYPCWSPDGARIVYSRSGWGVDNNGKLWLMNADGSSKTQLTP